MADEKKQATTIPSGIGATEFNTWKHHPVTKAYFQYLLDQRADIKGAAVEAWEGGKLSLAIADEMRGVSNTLKRAAEPDFAELVKFYDEINQMKKQELQADDNEKDN
ncbi:MAG: hypothetical protein Q7S17_09035 [Xanthobacteraceae bacterium]|nr:hypothetical protein [Xanthobacteraceae bacterium]